MRTAALRSKVAAEIMGLDVEDEYPLWEILSGVRANLPDEPKDAVRALTEHALRDLAARGLVAFARRRWRVGSDAIPGPVDEPLAVDEAGALLSADHAWVVNDGGAPDLVVTATDAGRRLYYAGEAELVDLTPTPDRRHAPN